MIVGIGVDLVKIERVREMVGRHGDRARRRLFTPRELAECGGRSDPGECLAARLAAKEAGLKALGTGKAPGVLWTDVEITRGPGCPRITFTGVAGEHADRLGVERAWVSLSHEDGMACAMVVLEGR